MINPADVDLSVKIAGVKLKNPVMPASGCFGYGEEFSGIYDLSLLGAVVTKGTTLEPREGNPQPRSIETPGGMINKIGLENPGIKFVLKEKMPFLRRFNVVVFLNLSGLATDDYINAIELIEKADESSRPDLIEVNISCPNVKKGGMVFGQNPALAAELIRNLKKITKIPLIVKLTPNVTDVVAVAKVVVEAGADAISLINTLLGMALIRNGPDKGKWVLGGLSGPCIKPIALRCVWQVFQANLGVPIIGVGGIMNIQDALEFFMVGADAVQVGTANFVNVNVMPEIISGLEKYLRKNNFSSFEEWKNQNRLIV